MALNSDGDRITSDLKLPDPKCPIRPNLADNPPLVPDPNICVPKCLPCEKPVLNRRPVPSHICNLDELADLLKVPQLEAGFRFVCDPNTGESFLVQGVYDEETKVWEYTKADGTVVVFGVDFVKCPNVSSIVSTFCDTESASQTYTRVMCKVDGQVDITKTQWVDNVTNTLIPSAPATIKPCEDDEKCVSIPTQPMVDCVVKGEAEEICDFENGIVVFEENFETPSTTQGTGLGALLTDFDVSEAGQPAYWGQMYAEGIYRVFPGGYVPVGGPDPAIHFNWLPYPPYSTGHASFNLQASTGAAGLRPFYTEIDMTAGKCYTLVTDAMDTHEQSVVDQGVDLADLGLVINGVVVGSTGPITAGTGTDQGNVYTVSFTAQTSGPQLMEFISNNSATNGNDIYVDYIRIVEGTVTILPAEIECIEFDQETVKCPDGTYEVINIKDGVVYEPQGEVKKGTCCDCNSCGQKEDSDGGGGAGGGDFDDSGIIAAIEAQDQCEENDLTLVGDGSNGGITTVTTIPAGAKSLTVNNIASITEVQVGGSTFELGDGRRLNSHSWGTDRGNCVNELLPEIRISGGTYQWTELR